MVFQRADDFVVGVRGRKGGFQRGRWHGRDRQVWGSRGGDGALQPHAWAKDDDELDDGPERRQAASEGSIGGKDRLEDVTLKLSLECLE